MVDIFALDLRTNRLRQVTHASGSRRQNNFPELSPDGREILFLAIEGAHSQLHVMTASGDSERVVARFDSLSVGYPQWSPDGQHIVFTGFGLDLIGANPTWLYRVKPDGTGSRQLTAKPIANGCPRWSPDGAHLLVSEAIPLGRSRVFRMAYETGDTATIGTSDSLSLLCPVMPRGRTRFC